MKKLIVVIIIIAAAAAGWGYYFLRKKPAAGVDPAASAPRTVKVERGDIDLRVSTTGKIIPNLEVEIKSKASGQIVNLPYDISDPVTSGALLAELDPVDENRNVTLKEVAVAASRAKLAQASEQLSIAEIDSDTGTSSAQAELNASAIKYRDALARQERGEELYKKLLVSKEQLDAARSETATAANAMRQAEVKYAETKTLPHSIEGRRQDIALQKTQLKSAEVDLDNASQRLKETRIFAPMDGVITARPVQAGQIIASGISNVGGGTSLMTLSDMSRMFVSATVDESDIGKVKLDQTAIISVDSFPGRRFRGKVVRIATKGLNTSNVVTFEVKIEIGAEGRELLKPEMTANVEIQADRRQDVLLLPNDSVQFSRDGYIVEIPDGPDKTKRVKVLTGLTDGLNTEITSGVVENEEVSLSPLVRSRWAQGQQGGQGRSGGGGQNFNRGVQMMGYRMSGAGGGGGGRGR